MNRRAWRLGAAVACCAAIAAVSPVKAQQPVPRDEPRQERRDDRRDDRRTTTEQVPADNRQYQERQDVRTGDAHSGQAHRAKSVLGSQVTIQGGLAIGTVDDIIFSDDGYIDYLVVLNQGKYVSVPWQAAKFNFERQNATVSVNITPQQFQQVPTFTQTQWPNFAAPAYRQQIYGYY